MPSGSGAAIHGAGRGDARGWGWPGLDATADPLASAWWGEGESWHLFGSAPEAGAVARAERRPGLVCMWWLGPPEQLQNNIWVVDPAAAGPAERVLGDLAARLADSRTSTDLRLPPGPSAQPWLVAAPRHGFEFSGADPLMACDLREAAAPAIPSDVRVRAATDAATRAAAFAVITAVWGDPEICRFFAPPSGTRLYLAEHRGVPVSAATTVRHGNGVSVFSVSTRPEHRGRGLAAALLAGIARNEARAGVRWATLRTGDDLIPFYSRAGYRLIGHAQGFRRQA